ncbi:CHAT domain-containing protein [Rhodocollybia butyracea]|uniref:CHAT domain-containing protein n=1 Tax=Rhodocollybia butyracea TaxID=206335 RepID=A0A9P5PED6_9AGAR|nr:CHAT domain-containing protein [Rhodocollybia butyracea]
MDWNTADILKTMDKISSARAALHRCPVGHPERAFFLSQLGLGIWDRFHITGRPVDLDECIRLNREALRLRPVGDLQRASSLNNLGMGLYTRFQQTSCLEDLNEYIKFLGEVVLLHSVGHPQHTSSLNNLSSALRVRFRQKGQLKDLDECIRLNEEALHSCSNFDRSSFLQNIIVALTDRFKLTGHLKDLTKSIQLNQEVLVYRPLGHPGRASSLRSLGKHFTSVRWATRNVLLYSTALVWATELAFSTQVTLRISTKLFHSIEKHFNSVLWSTRSVVLCSITLVWASELAFSTQAASKILMNLFNWIERHFYCVLWATQNVLLPSRALARASGSRVCHTLAGKLVVLDEPVKSHLDALLLHPVAHKKHVSSLETLGHPKRASSLKNLGVSLGSSCHLEDLNESVQLHWEALLLLPVGHPELASLLNSFSVCLWNCFQKTHHQEDLIDCVSTSKRSAKDIYSRVSDCLKGVENWVKFTRPHHDLAQSNLDAYIKGLSLISYSLSMMPVISLQYRYLSSIIHLPEFVSDAASQAIRLEQNSPVLIPMVEGCYDEVKALARRLTKARSNIKTNPKLYNHILQTTLHELWDLIVSPVVTKLQELHIPDMSRIFWCPTSILSTLPLHAAGPASHDKKKFFLPDLYISSYTPTLAALITAFNPTESSLQLPHLLVAGQYDNFLNTKKEVNEVVQYRKHIAVTSLEEASATKNAVEKSLVDHEWLHIASHGTLVPTEPFSSYFSLAGGSRFTLLDVIRLNLPNATFAFLSACHTAEQSPGSVHNEVIHLAAAMQFCGFRSVVGTMWEMADVDGPEMVKDFYSYVFSDENRSRCNETGVPARALSEAIRKMRGKKGVTLERWVNFVHIGA